MSDWHGIRATLTKEQRIHIEKFKKKQKIKNDNQLVKFALEELLGVNLADATRTSNQKLPLEYLTAYYFYEYLKRTYKKSPKNQKIIDESFKKWGRGFWRIYTDNHNKKLANANEMWDSFKHKQKVGRPSKSKEKRGRPKTNGYD